MKYYEDWEIREMYLAAKDKKAQIAILAELCLTTRRKIKEKLAELGVAEIPEEPPARMVWTPEDNARLLKLSEQDIKHKDIARLYGVSVYAVRSQLYKLREGIV